MALTPKQQRFVQEYLIGLNATQAAIRAGYSERTAQEQSSRLLSNVMVQSAIAAQQKGREERANATADEVLREINRMAMVDPADYADVKSPADIKGLPEHVRRAIVGWKWDRNGRFVMEFAKQSAMDMLARHHSLFNDKLRVDATVTGTVYRANIPPR